MSNSRRRHARSLAVMPLDDDDLLSEILLRLPPQPSSLPRASLVCKRWRGLVSDRGFFRRFRLHHRCNPPLLGFFDRYEGMSFLPTLEGPNRIPPEHFSLERDDDDDLMSLGCCHGLSLGCLRKLFQILVWDPVTGDQHRISIPAAFDNKKSLINGAVLRAVGDYQHFQVVLVVADVDEEQREQVLACVYSPKTRSWGNLISTPLPFQAKEGPIPTMVWMDDVVLVGGCLY
ncbi:hypothetical protein ACQ4PT_057365 [Festuca glaucescens]